MTTLRWIKALFWLALSKLSDNRTIMNKAERSAILWEESEG